MRRSLSLSYVVRWLTTRTSQADFFVNQAGKQRIFYLATGLILAGILLGACSGPFGGSAPSTSTPSTLPLNKLGWCAKPLMVFHDEGASTPTATATPNSPLGTVTPKSGGPSTISDWSVVKNSLGFPVYLPTHFPHGTCLVSAQATIHDPVLGGSFTIGYLLPDHTSLSLSEAPLKSQNVSFQCSPTNAVTPTAPKGSSSPATSTPPSSQLCSGAKGNTDIVLSGSGTVDHLQQIFDNLQTNVNWIPS